MSKVIRLSSARPEAPAHIYSLRDEARFASAFAVLCTGGVLTALSPFGALWLLFGVIGLA